MAVCHTGFVKCRGVEGLYTRLDIPSVAQPALLVVTLVDVSMDIGQVKGWKPASALRRAACTWLAQGTLAVVPCARGREGSNIPFSVHIGRRGMCSERGRTCSRTLEV